MDREELLAWAQKQLDDSKSEGWFPDNDSVREGYQIAYREVIEKLGNTNGT